jgi:serine/threonine-protein kinase RsbW
MSATAQRSVVTTISTAFSDLAGLYPWLDTAAEPDALPPALLQRMHVALDEAVLNVAMHALPPGGEERITLQYHAGAQHIALIISDPGPPFNPLEAPTSPRATSIQDAEIGGNGLVLLRHFCKDIAYRRAGGQNELTLRFPKEN